MVPFQFHFITWTRSYTPVQCSKKKFCQIQDQIKDNIKDKKIVLNLAWKIYKKTVRIELIFEVVTIMKFLMWRENENYRDKILLLG